MQSTGYYERNFGVRKELSHRLLNGFLPVGITYVLLHLIGTIRNQQPIAGAFISLGLLALLYSSFLHLKQDNQQLAIKISGLFFLFFFLLKPQFMPMDSTLPFGFLFIFIFFIIGVQGRRNAILYLGITFLFTLSYILYYNYFTSTNISSKGTFLNQIFFLLSFVLLFYAFWIQRKSNIRLLHLLQSNDQLVQKLIDANPSLIFITDENLQLHLSNEGANQFMKNGNAILFNDYIKHPGLKHIIKDFYSNRASFDKAPVHLHNIELQSPGQEKAWYNLTLIPQKNLESEKGDVLVIGSDVTQLMLQRLESLHMSENRFRNIFDNSPLGIGIYDTTRTRFINANTKLLEMIDCTAEELPSIDWHQLITSSDVRNFLNEENKKLKTGQLQAVQLKSAVTSTKGKQFWVNISFSRFGQEESPLYLMFIENISRQEEATRQLEESENRYRTIFENVYEGIMVYDQKLKKAIDCNEKILDLLQFESKTKLLDQYDQIFSPECLQYQLFWDESKPDSAIHFAQQNGKFQVECILRKQNEKDFPAEINLIQLPSIADHYFVMIVKDLSDSRKKEALIKKKVAALRKKNRELQKYIESNKELENFAFIVAHDLKSPLRTITGFAQLLQRKAKDKLNPEEERYLGLIQSSVGDMASFIDGLLTYGKVNKQQLEIMPHQPKTIIEKTIGNLQGIIEEKQATIRYENLDMVLKADPFKLQQVFQNLIQNAIKYSKEDVPPVIFIAASEKDNVWEFKVEDNGLGLPDKLKTNIFSLFYKHHNEKSQDSSGIGLSICKKIAEQHGGRIWVESDGENGSTFFFTVSKDLS